jgi:hypothetical protein
MFCVYTHAVDSHAVIAALSLLLLLLPMPPVHTVCKQEHQCSACQYVASGMQGSVMSHVSALR